MRAFALNVLRGGVLALAASQTVAAQAQTIDYDAFEQMFGEPVTSSATGKPQRVSDAPVDMVIVTADDIRRSGADTLPEVLRFVSGVDVRQYGQQDSAVGIRGYNTPLNPRVLVLLDGRQVYEDDYGFTVWPLIPVALGAIRQIEIIKGPNAALYGFNAVSGVINIVTYDPLHDKVDTAFVQGGSRSQGYAEAAATAQRPASYGVRLSAEGFRADEFSAQETDPASRPIGDPRSGTVEIDARLQVASDTELDAGASIGSLDSGYYIDTGLYQPFADRANTLQTRLISDTRYGLLTLDLYRNENRSSFTNPAFYSQWRSDVLVAKASDLLKITSRHTVRLAVEYRNDAVSSGLTFSGRTGYDLLAASAMWEWDVAPALSLTNAVRVDGLALRHDGTQFTLPGIGPLFKDSDIVEPSFNSGIVYKVTNRDTLRLGAARAIQLPSLVDFGLTATSPTGAFIVAGQPSLSPSVVTNYEVDYDRTLSRLDATVRVAVFAQHTETSIGAPSGSGYSLLPDGQLLLMARNFGNSDEAGGEATIGGTSRAGIRWSLGYALAAVRDGTLQAQLVEAPSVNYQRQTPTNSVVASLGRSWHRFDADVRAHWQSHLQDFEVIPGTVMEQPTTVPNYVTIDARIGYRVSRTVTVSATAEQLGQRSLTETAGSRIQRRFLAGLRVRF